MRSVTAKVALAAMLALAACSGGAGKGDAKPQEANMQLSIPAIAAGASVPVKFTCDGEDTSPALEWSGAPEDTKSLVLILDDPDAPGGTFRHWGIYDIPPTVTGLHEGAANEDGFMQAENGFGSQGYLGPCPPKGDRPHHYHFKLFALDVAELDVGAKPKVEEVEKALDTHVLAKAEVVASYGRE
ncbi:MAG TPA: YbhB/YbcL family Raf kinase inhibitor-like protein [Sphingomonadaceae bacterium]